MRTTIRLDDELHKEAKRRAEERGTTLRARIEESLRERLAIERNQTTQRQRIRLKTAGEGGTLPGINLDDSASLFGLVDQTA